MKLFIKIALIVNILVGFSAHAKEVDLKQYYNKPYTDVRTNLINNGWEAVPNKQINDTSLYAQSIYENGYPEVVDCISMERDQCQFVLSKNKKQILVTTKEKHLNVESIGLIN